MTNPGAALAATEPVVQDSPRPADLDQLLLDPLWMPAPSLRWWFAVSGALAVVWAMAITYTVLTGIGTWGNEMPSAWGFGITDMVWWIGIGHAGTFISAFLLLLEQPWRASINRLAEAMTLFALVNAATFPLLHLGRPWFAYWLLPYPATMGVWPNHRSPLIWDVYAISTYIIVSLLFWYAGLVPDLAAARDRAPQPWRRRLYGLFALGWRGSARDWGHWRVAYGLMAGVATPLVVSVHSVISLDFTAGIAPGWHSTLFPPYFVIGALHSGFAMVLILLVPTRSFRKFDQVATGRHLDALSRMLLTTGCLMALCYATEAFVSWYGGEPAEFYVVDEERPAGLVAGWFWLMLACNCLAPQALWFSRVRRSPRALVAIGAAVLVGMWIERYIIIVASLARDFLPSSWGPYTPTVVDWSLLVGSLGLFVFLYLLFLRFVPYVPVSEVKKLVYERDHR